MIAVVVDVGMPTSLLLEDAAILMVLSTVEICCDGAEAVSVLPLANRVWFFWAV